MIGIVLGAVIGNVLGVIVYKFVIEQLTDKFR